jgi:hypothetical protein
VDDGVTTPSQPPTIGHTDPDFAVSDPTIASVVPRHEVISGSRDKPSRKVRRVVLQELRTGDNEVLKR